AVRVEAAGQPAGGDLEGRPLHAHRVMGADQGVVVGQEVEAFDAGLGAGRDRGADRAHVVAEVGDAGGLDAGQDSQAHAGAGEGKRPILARARRAPRPEKGGGRLSPAPVRIRARCQASVQALLEVADLALGLLAAPAVLLLELAREVFAVALGNVEDVVGELAPARLRLALQLRPLAGNDVLVHASPRSWGEGPPPRRPGGMLAHRASRSRRGTVSPRFTWMTGDQRGSVPPVSSAASSTFSPTFWTSLPAPATVLHALSVPAANRAIRNSSAMRFMGCLPGSCPGGLAQVGAMRRGRG